MTKFSWNFANFILKPAYFRTFFELFDENKTEMTSIYDRETSCLLLLLKRLISLQDFFHFKTPLTSWLPSLKRLPPLKRFPSLQDFHPFNPSPLSILPILQSFPLSILLFEVYPYDSSLSRLFILNETSNRSYLFEDSLFKSH